MKTAEEIAQILIDDWWDAASHEGEQDLKSDITQAILADRAERDKRVIEILEPFEKWAAYYNRYSCLDNYEIHFSHSDVGNVLINVGHLRQASALLAELRKGEK